MGTGSPVFLLRNHVGQITVCRLTHSKFGVFFVDFVFGGYRSGNVEYFSVQERYTHFQRVCHTHFVRFQQNVANEPEMDVDILHFGHIVLIFHFVVVRTCQFGVMIFPVGLSGFFTFFFLEHESVADEAFLQVLAATNQVVSAFYLGQFFATAPMAFRTGRGSLVKGSRS